MLPPKLAKKPKRESRWRSQRHLNFVRGHACSVCGSGEPIEVAHVRLGSGAGMGQKPNDWRVVSLCKDCHRRQHERGEASFWQAFTAETGLTVDDMVDAFCKASPVAADIRKVRLDG